jgi:hypothetical protein
MAIAYFGKFFPKITEVSQNFWAIISTDLIVLKMG